MVKRTTSSPVKLLMSWCMLTTLAPVAVFVIVCRCGRGNQRFSPFPPPLQDDVLDWGLEGKTLFSRETKLGRTPNGGIYQTAFYKDDKGNPADKSVATGVEVVEYDLAGKVIHQSYGPIQSADGV